jgi:6-methylsalicylate decarboxylase
VPLGESSSGKPEGRLRGFARLATRRISTGTSGAGRRLQPFDTTRAAFGRVRAWTQPELTHLRIILSHAGGGVPFLAHRFVQTISTEVDPAADPDALLADLQRFYLATGLGPAPRPARVCAFARPDHVLFGSDIPFASERMSHWFTGQVDAFTADNELQARQIAHGNAVGVLAKLDRLTPAASR